MLSLRGDRAHFDAARPTNDPDFFSKIRQKSLDRVGGGNINNKVRIEPPHQAARVAVGALFTLTLAAVPVYPQDLTPRAYVITPAGSHAVILSYAFSKGAVLVDPTVPIEDLTGTLQVPALGYYHSFSFLGRSSNVTLIAPYLRGNFEATVDDVFTQVYRSGLADARVRFAVNLYGGRAMNPREYVKWNEKRLVGVSLTVAIPTGQYDPARVINAGTNRWGFKPEMGFTRRWNRWVADWYIGGWFFTPNNKYFPGQSRRTQAPILSGEGHFGYYVTPRLWASFDANFWAGSRTTVNGVEKQDLQRNSRIGATVSFPITRHQALTFSYSEGAYIAIGGDYRTFAAAWQYSWITSPR